MVPSKFSTVNGGNNPMTASLLVVSNGSSFDVWIGSFLGRVRSIFMANVDREHDHMMLNHSLLYILKTIPQSDKPMFYSFPIQL